MIVTPKKIPVRHNGRRYLAGEEFEIDNAGYERISQHVEVVSEEDLVLDKPVDKMTVPELKAYAELHEIDLGDANKKPEILAAIQAAQQAGGNPNGGAAGGDQ